MEVWETNPSMWVKINYDLTLHSIAIEKISLIVKGNYSKYFVIKLSKSLNDVIAPGPDQLTDALQSSAGRLR